MKSKILLIEDNPKNRYLTTFLLEKTGCEVIEAEDGPSGIEFARTHQPDLILLDIQLPGADGYSVLKTLKADAQCRDIKVIAVTSFAMPGDRERILEAGCADYIPKPIDPDTFPQVILDHLQSPTEP